MYWRLEPCLGAAGKPTRSNPRQPPVITTQKDRARDDQQKRNWREVGGGRACRSFTVMSSSSYSLKPAPANRRRRRLLTVVNLPLSRAGNRDGFGIRAVHNRMPMDRRSARIVFEFSETRATHAGTVRRRSRLPIILGLCKLVGFWPFRRGLCSLAGHPALLGGRDGPVQSGGAHSV